MGVRLTACKALPDVWGLAADHDMAVVASNSCHSCRWAQAKAQASNVGAPRDL